jgi:hypothetical protein
LCLLPLLLLRLLIFTNRDCPGVFMRFVEDPQAESAKLTLKDLNPQQQQQQAGSSPAAAAAQPVDIQLSQSELQQLLKQLVLALSSSKSSSSSVGSSMSPTAAAALGVPGNRQITLQPIPSSSSSTSIGGTAAAAAAAAAAGGRLLLSIDGVLAAELEAAHVTSLVTVMEDLVGQLPGQYSTAPPAVQVC